MSVVEAGWVTVHEGLREKRVAMKAVSYARPKPKASVVTWYPMAEFVSPDSG